MGDERDGSSSKGKQEFERAAAGKSANVLGELWSLLRANKKWWLLPILVVLVLLGALIVLSGTAVAPFIYTLF